MMNREMKESKCYVCEKKGVFFSLNLCDNPNCKDINKRLKLIYRKVSLRDMWFKIQLRRIIYNYKDYKTMINSVNKLNIKYKNLSLGHRLDDIVVFNKRYVSPKILSNNMKKGDL